MISDFLTPTQCPKVQAIQENIPQACPVRLSWCQKLGRKREQDPEPVLKTFPIQGEELVLTQVGHCFRRQKEPKATGEIRSEGSKAWPLILIIITITRSDNCGGYSSVWPAAGYIGLKETQKRFRFQAVARTSSLCKAHHGHRRESSASAGVDRCYQNKQN